MTPWSFLSADVNDGELRASTNVLLNSHSHDKHNVKKNWLTKLRTLQDASPPMCSWVPLPSVVGYLHNTVRWK